jgi:hypothetical protein
MALPPESESEAQGSASQPRVAEPGMTPEERAKDIFHALLTSRTMREGKEADQAAAFAIIASSIRSAENDVLERVAFHYDAEAKDHRAKYEKTRGLDDGYGAWCFENAAEFARSLKHKI